MDKPKISPNLPKLCNLYCEQDAINQAKYKVIQKKLKRNVLAINMNREFDAQQYALVILFVTYPFSLNILSKK